MADKLHMEVLVNNLRYLGWPGKLVVADCENYIVFLELVSVFLRFHYCGFDEDEGLVRGFKRMGMALFS